MSSHCWASDPHTVATDIFKNVYGGQVITSHIICGMQLIVHVLDLCAKRSYQKQGEVTISYSISGM